MVYTLSHSTSPFYVMNFFEMGFHELLAQAGNPPGLLPPE
jgi:hypothetical protein